MSNRYTVTILPRKVGHWITLSNPHDSTELGHYYYMTEEAMIEIDNWVRANNLGNRMAFAMWQLKNKEAVTAFMLRWGG